MGLPWGDWQFWIATVIALGALVVVLRMVLPEELLPKKLRRSGAAKKATLTIGGRPAGTSGKPPTR